MSTLLKTTRNLQGLLFVAAPGRQLAHKHGYRQRGLALGCALALSAGLGGCSSSSPSAAPAGSASSHPAPASKPKSQQSLNVASVLSATVSAESLRKHVFTLADDSFEGRGASTQGLLKAAAYIEQQLKAAGARPGFGTVYRQPFEMTVRVEVGADNRLMRGKDKATASQVQPYGFSNRSEAPVKAKAVFVGYGIRSKDHGYDDYAGIDVTGKIAVVLSGEPGDDDPKSPFDGTRRTRHSSAAFKATVARDAGAVALLIVKETVRAPKAPQAPAGIPVMAVSEQVAKKLLGVDAPKSKKLIASDYTPRSAELDGELEVFVDLKRIRRSIPNVAGLVGPESAQEVVVIGAHYDHLGLGDEGSLEEKPDGLVHNGADDNASGVAALLEAAAVLAQAKDLKRQVMIVLFAGEEAGLLGSAYFVAHAPVDLKNVSAMINLDMVGRLRKDKLMVFGVGTAKEWTELVKTRAAGHNLQAALSGDGYGPSDHTSFYAAGVPVLHLFTGAHSEYHRPSDDASTLDYRGLARVSAFATDMAHVLAASEGRPTYVRAPAPDQTKHGGGRGYGAYFGSVPDFGQEVEGVRFSDIRPGSPAAKAGVKKGDTLVAFDGTKILNLRDFTYALRKASPGQTVKIVVLRDEKPVSVDVTLGRRSD